MQHLRWLCVALPLAALMATVTGCSSRGASSSSVTTSAVAIISDTSAPSSATTSLPSGPARTATGANASGRDDRLGPPGSGRPAAGELAAGDCYNETLGSAETPVREFTVVGCRVAHDGEVFLLDALGGAAGAAFPGEREAERAALRICLPAFDGFVGRSYASSSLRVSMLRPVSSSWASGDRNVVCSVYDPDLNPLVGSVSGTKR